MRWLLAPVVLCVLGLAALPSPAEAHMNCEGVRQGLVRGHHERVVGRAQGADEFLINERYACAEVWFFFNGVFTADKPNVDVPDSHVTIHQVAAVNGTAVESWFNFTIPDNAPLTTFGVATQPWFSGAPVEVTWDVTGAGQIEFSYRGYL